MSIDVGGGGCLRCKRDYKVNEVDSAGFPLHVHYCNECCKQCKKCDKFFIITQFLPVLDHPTYVEWVSGRLNVRENPLGLLMGREVVDDSCLGCKPFRSETAPARVHPSPVYTADPALSDDVRLGQRNSNEEEPSDDARLLQESVERLEALLATKRSA
jgi:hypothetical protein